MAKKDIVPKDIRDKGASQAELDALHKVLTLLADVKAKKGNKPVKAILRMVHAYYDMPIPVCLREQEG